MWAWILFFINPGQEERDQWPDGEIEGLLLERSPVQGLCIWVQGSTFHTGSTGISLGPNGQRVPARHPRIAGVDQAGAEKGGLSSACGRQR